MTIANIISLVALSFSIVFSVCSMFFLFAGTNEQTQKISKAEQGRMQS